MATRSLHGDKIWCKKTTHDWDDIFLKNQSIYRCSATSCSFKLEEDCSLSESGWRLMSDFRNYIIIMISHLATFMTSGNKLRRKYYWLEAEKHLNLANTNIRVLYVLDRFLLVFSHWVDFLIICQLQHQLPPTAVMKLVGSRILMPNVTNSMGVSRWVLIKYWRPDHPSVNWIPIRLQLKSGIGPGPGSWN